MDLRYPICDRFLLTFGKSRKPPPQITRNPVPFYRLRFVRFDDPRQHLFARDQLIHDGALFPSWIKIRLYRYSLMLESRQNWKLIKVTKEVGLLHALPCYSLSPVVLSCDHVLSSNVRNPWRDPLYHQSKLHYVCLVSVHRHHVEGRTAFFMLDL